MMLAILGVFFLAATLPTVYAACDASYPYRSHNGTCNNLANHAWGSAGMTMPRIIAAKHRDTGSEPNERKVTRTLLSARDRGKFDPELNATERAKGTETESRGLNAYAIILMQFLSHDISLMPVTSFFEQDKAFGITIPDCENDSDAGKTDELCALATGRDGELFLQNKLVTRDTLGVKDSEGYLAPDNVVTSYIDLNPVYGSSDETSDALRSHVQGKLKVGVNGDLPRNNPTGSFTENECDLFGPSDTSHMAGDARVDENFVLTSIHLLFVREHNRIADQLVASRPDWDDEKLYQEARKRNIAIFQHIIYDELLPRVYGSKAHKKILRGRNKYRGYNPKVDPSATVEFSTAAFRLHSMVNLPSLFLSDTCEMSKGVVSTSENPYFYQERTNCDPIDYRRIGHDDIIRGALIQHAQEYDNRVTRTLMNIRIGAPGNVDVQAANIFRGRQLCLGTIDELRQAVGVPSVYDSDDREVAPRSYREGELNKRRGQNHLLKKGCVTGKEIECFRRLVSNSTLATQMHSMYEDVDNVDPYIALVGEKPINTKKGHGRNKSSSSLGATSTLLGLKQFQKIRDGDRFWYEKPGMFTRDELREIKKVSLSDLLKANFPELASEILDDALQTMPSACIDEDNDSSSSNWSSSGSGSKEKRVRHRGGKNKS